VLIIGGGNVALEKLTFLLKSSPNAKVNMVAPYFRTEVEELAAVYDVELILKSYDKSYLEEKHMVIVATDNHEVNKQVYKECKKRQLLVNVADTPELCDFYLGGIVTKGNIKIAISTNGKSPTMAKRLRQFFEEFLPEEMDDLVQNLNEFRNGIKGDFASKVSKMNKLTKGLLID
jgi:precorrin-2 dehydrogenase/sirohydrochlorin ferrochelatase